MIKVIIVYSFKVKKPATKQVLLILGTNCISVDQI